MQTTTLTSSEGIKEHKIIDISFHHLTFRMYTEEGKNHFTVRDNVLGHSQQGGTPSSFDRNMSTKLAAKTVSWLTEQLDHFASRDGNTPNILVCNTLNIFQGTVHAETPESATVLGSKQATFAFQPVQELAKQTDFQKRYKISVIYENFFSIRRNR